jgi:hypothetical protein
MSHAVIHPVNKTAHTGINQFHVASQVFDPNICTYDIVGAGPNQTIKKQVCWNGRCPVKNQDNTFQPCPAKPSPPPLPGCDPNGMCPNGGCPSKPDGMYITCTNRDGSKYCPDQYNSSLCNGICQFSRAPCFSSIGN